MLDKELFENLRFDKNYPFKLSYNQNRETFPLHWHNCVEVVLAYQTNIQYEINNRLYTLTPKDILFIWSGELHALLHQPQPSKVLLLQFDYPVISDRIDFQDKLYLFHQVRMIKAKENPELAAALEYKLLAIKDLFYHPGNFTEINICIALYQFFMILGNYLLSTSNFHCHLPELTTRHARVTEQMIAVCSYLSRHCLENIPLEAAAEYAGFSKFHFSRLFKEFTGDSYTDFIAKERLHKAEELLTTPSLSITEVAFQSGFNSISSFNRIFKQFNQCSPTKFRDLYQNSHK